MSEFDAELPDKGGEPPAGARGRLPDGQESKGEPTPITGDRPLDAILGLDPYAPLSENEEQAVRDFWGYASSEKRTRAERQAVADRICGRTPPTLEEARKAWIQQAQRMERRRVQKRASLGLLDDTAERKKRADAYARWYEREVEPARAEERRKQAEETARTSTPKKEKEK